MSTPSSAHPTLDIFQRTFLNGTSSWIYHLLPSARNDFTQWPQGPSSQSYGFLSSHIQMWELDHKEDWVLKNWRFQTMVLEKTLEGPLDSKEIKPVNPKENQSWIFTGRTDAEAEAPILWPPDAKNWLIWKDPDAGKDWRQKEKRVAEDEIVTASLT